MRFGLLISAVMIFAMGLVMIYSTTSAEVLDHDLAIRSTDAFMRQFFYAAVGILLGWQVMRYGYVRLIRLSPLLLTVAICLLVLVLIPGIGKEVNGSRRWLHLAGVSFQPSEFLKIILPAFFIYSYRDERIVTLKQFMKLSLILFLPIVLIAVEPNNGTAAVIALCLIALFSLTRIPVKYWAYPLFALMMAGAISAYQLPYVSARLNVYFHPELDVHGKGHQPLQARIAAGSGKMFGKGPGRSLQKLSYLPEAQNDYIAAIFAEEFGFIGIAFLIALYMALAYFGFAIAYQCRDLQGAYLAGAITFLISFQAFMNLGVVSGLLPSTGLNLPLFSQGGSSLMANMLGIACLCDIRRRERALCVS